jgi:LAO/AO transport system kinase
LINQRELARSITALENNKPEALQALRDALDAHGKAHGNSPATGRVIGITGAPGAGKSSLVDAIARELRAREKTVAILAVDPSSRSTGGAILGDRIRMRDHYADPGIFIRSMATRGNSGGLAATTHHVAEWLRVNGFDYVLIETVGVGQDEIAIAGAADIVAVVLVPGMGDDIQAIKAGVMEIADVYVVNKADYEGAERTVNEIEAMLNLGHGAKPPILKTIATAPSGVVELIQQLDSLPRRRHAPEAAHFTIDHVGVAVRSLNASARFYELLGLDTSLRETVAHEKVRVAMIPTGESRIELLEALDADSTIAKFIEKRGEGLHHVALRVPDLQRAVEALGAAGARVLHEPRRGAGGHLYTFVHPSSTGGVLWELIQA